MPVRSPPANINTPAQIVVCGEEAAIERVVALAPLQGPGRP